MLSSALNGVLDGLFCFSILLCKVIGFGSEAISSFDTKLLTLMAALAKVKGVLGIYALL